MQFRRRPFPLVPRLVACRLFGRARRRMFVAVDRRGARRRRAAGRRARRPWGAERLGVRAGAKLPSLRRRRRRLKFELACLKFELAWLDFRMRAYPTSCGRSPGSRRQGRAPLRRFTATVHWFAVPTASPFAGRLRSESPVAPAGRACLAGAAANVVRRSGLARGAARVQSGSSTPLRVRVVRARARGRD